MPHTPTPWHLSKDARYVRYSECADGHIADPPHGANLADMECFGGPRDERDANAAFIVPAVNSHAALLAECKALAGLESSISEDVWYASSECPATFRAARAVIRQAEEQP